MNRRPLSPEMERRVLRHCAVVTNEISMLASELIGAEQPPVPAVRVPIAIDFQQGKLMNRRAISCEQRAALFAHLDVVVAELRKMADATVDVGPVLVEHYRVLSAVARYREIVDSLPEIATAQDTEAPRA